MDDRSKRLRGAQEGYSPYNTPLAQENGAVGGPSNPSAENPHVPTSVDHDEAQMNSDLLSAWMQRLQVLTIVTTFLSSMDGTLFSLSALNTQIGLPMGTTSRELTYSCLSGALILHICACILGYIASFSLIQYRILETSEEDSKVGGIQSLDLGAAQPAQRTRRRLILEPVRPISLCQSFVQRPGRLRFLSSSPSSQSPPPPPMSLLTHCYYTTLCLTTVGFILALIGILTYIWAGLPLQVGIFATVCLGVGISAALWALAK